MDIAGQLIDEMQGRKHVKVGKHINRQNEEITISTCTNSFIEYSKSGFLYRK